ncbi:MAG: hypothetical protein K2H41_10745 [Acetatifactor sp.]|nr:hypothetical protein [Acetatifactor sp.]
MKRFGNRKQFALEYYGSEPDGYNCFKCWIEGQDICRYVFQGKKVFSTHCDVYNIKDWFVENWDIIMSSCEFPLGIQADSSTDFYEKSGDFDSDDDEEFYEWFSTRQDWWFSHSWYVSRRNEYIPNVFFRRKDDMMEIDWDSSNLYEDEGVQFIYPKGIYYLEINVFKNIICSFVKSLNDL